MTQRLLFLGGLFLFMCVNLSAAVQDVENEGKSTSEPSVNRTPKIHGTLRGKFEYQPNENEYRFEVRNARVSIDGDLLKRVAYKAEIDLCDEGKIKMLDAYTRITPFQRFQVTIGQMRVPFTIDAHRSPHQQYFANRSFIAKQVGNVRDVGAKIGYNANVGFPVVVEAGLFNGSGLTNQKDFWSNSINFSAKAQLFIPHGWNVTLSVQKIKPSVSIMMYDIGAYYHGHGWHVEAEYLYKDYQNDSFNPVSAVDAFLSYDFELNKGLVRYITPLVRYDYMDDHSDGTVDNDTQKLSVTDYKRHRVTAGVTFSLARPFVSDIRLNYEKYFYDNSANAKTSERDKIVLEVMTRF